MADKYITRVASQKQGEPGVAPPADTTTLETPHIVISLSGGMVQEVYASGTLEDLIVVDWDVRGCDEGVTEVVHDGYPLRAYVAHPTIYALERLAGTHIQAVINAADRDQSDAAAD